MTYLLTTFLLQTQGAAFDNSFITIISRSGLVAKSVLVVLLFFSIVSWAIIADKYFAFKRSKRQNGQFYRTFKKSNYLNELATAAVRLRHSQFAKMFLTVYDEISHHNSRSESGAPTVQVKSMAPPTHEVMDRAIARSGLSEQAGLEKNLSFLATTASATPFIGLFGTVWGIINAFEAIGGARSTDLSIVAPGIAEALIATAMGLAAAIPAVIGYNYFSHRIRNIGSEMEEFSMELMTFVEQQQVLAK